MPPSSTFYDMLNVSQDYGHQLPIIGDKGRVNIDLTTGEMSEHIIAYPHREQGSYSTTMEIIVRGSELQVNANPSRYNRTDNLFGFTEMDDCFEFYNNQLQRLGLPKLTKCTRIWQRWDDDELRFRTLSDGAVIREVHLTTNHSVGQGNEATYLKALSSQPYKNSIGRLHTNGMTCDWLTKQGNGGSLIYPSVYQKAYELTLHAMSKAKRLGDELAIYKLQRVINYCEQMGVVRKESKVKNAQLRRAGFRHYGLFEEAELKKLHEPLLSVGNKLEVESMELETISETLLSTGVCGSTRAANTSAFYAYQWLHGSMFDLAKSQVKIHRARLRCIGIDIAIPCDITRFSPVIIKRSQVIEVTDLSIPDWYEMPLAA